MERTTRPPAVSLASSSARRATRRTAAQDPAAFAQLLAEEFVACETVAKAAPRKPPPVAPSAAVAVSARACHVAGFDGWHFGERCLATYRVLFGRPLWAVTPSPRAARAHTPPCTSCSSDASETSSVGHPDALELPDAHLAPLPTVDELLRDGELQTHGELALDNWPRRGPHDANDVLAGLVLDLDGPLGALTAAGHADADADTAELAAHAPLTDAEEQELRLLVASPCPQAPSTPRGALFSDVDAL